jgi:hypothetical protein
MTAVHDVQEGVPKTPADTAQITFRMPTPLLDEADMFATYLSNLRRVPVSRTDVIREAAARGFEAMLREAIAQDTVRYRVQAFDGHATTWLCWMGRSEDDAIAEATRRADEDDGSKWSVYRVFRGGEETAMHIAIVNRGNSARARVRHRSEVLAREADAASRKKR